MTWVPGNACPIQVLQGVSGKGRVVTAAEQVIDRGAGEGIHQVVGRRGCPQSGQTLAAGVRPKPRRRGEILWKPEPGCSGAGAYLHRQKRTRGTRLLASTGLNGSIWWVVHWALRARTLSPGWSRGIESDQWKAPFFRGIVCANVADSGGEKARNTPASTGNVLLYPFPFLEVKGGSISGDSRASRNKGPCGPAGKDRSTGIHPGQTIRNARPWGYPPGTIHWQSKGQPR
jgi:hypothetical protein